MPSLHNDKVPNELVVLYTNVIKRLVKTDRLMLPEKILLLLMKRPRTRDELEEELHEPRTTIYDCLAPMGDWELNGLGLVSSRIVNRRGQGHPFTLFFVKEEYLDSLWWNIDGRE